MHALTGFTICVLFFSGSIGTLMLSYVHVKIQPVNEMYTNVETDEEKKMKHTNNSIKFSVDFVLFLVRVRVERSFLLFLFCRVYY